MTTTAVRSMTAFARREARDAQGEVVCEIRSVNHRYLELAVRVPEGHGVLERAIRERLMRVLVRGKVDCNVTIRRGPMAGGLVVDGALAAEVVRAAGTIQVSHPGLTPLGLADVLRWPGVVNGALAPMPDDLVLEVVEQTLIALVAHREREGARLVSLLTERLAQMAGVVKTLDEQARAAGPRLRARLEARIMALGATVVAERLEQELALLVQRADVREELDRLGVHLAEIEQTLVCGEPLGRRLDFLMQELNREANTLASKSPSAEITAEAVTLKVFIEQMREQVQNLE